MKRLIIFVVMTSLTFHLISEAFDPNDSGSTAINSNNHTGVTSDASPDPDDAAFPILPGYEIVLARRSLDDEDGDPAPELSENTEKPNKSPKISKRSEEDVKSDSQGRSSMDSSVKNVSFTMETEQTENETEHPSNYNIVPNESSTNKDFFEEEPRYTADIPRRPSTSNEKSEGVNDVTRQRHKIQDEN